MAIKGLPGWEWHYPKGAPRYATDTAGNRYTARDVQSLQHGEVYEKRVPKEQRKAYKRKVGKATRYGPFHSIQDIIDSKQIKDDQRVWLQGHGTMVKKKKRKSPEGSRAWRSIGGLADFKDMRTALDMIEHGLHDTTPEVAKYTVRLRENYTEFTDIKEFFIYTQVSH